MMKAVISTESEEGHKEAWIQISGKYSPDVLDDVKNRTIEMWNEVFADGEIVEEPADGFDPANPPEVDKL